MRKTTEGKSLIPLTLATIFNGVTVVLVPLIGLGSDQVKKASVPEHNVEAYHVDEHKFEDARKLRTHLQSLSDDEAKNVTIILYMSPQFLADKDVKQDKGNMTETTKKKWMVRIDRGLGETRSLVSILCGRSTHHSPMR